MCRLARPSTEGIPEDSAIPLGRFRPLTHSLTRKGKPMDGMDSTSLRVSMLRDGIDPDEVKRMVDLLDNQPSEAEMRRVSG